MLAEGRIGHYIFFLQALDFWGDPVVGNDLLIRVPPSAEQDFLTNLKTRELGYRIEHEDIQK